MSVKIVTDSTSDITAQEAVALDIKVVPLKTVFEDGEYRDGIDLTTPEFYQKLVTSKKLPTTTQPSPSDFEEVFEPIVAAGDEAVAILLSSRLSGTVQSALIAKGTLGDGIYVVDSEHATLSLKVLIMRAVALRDEGKSAREIFEILQEEKKRLRIRAMVDTLDYLKKGGRLSKTAALAGTLLGIKPVICLEKGAIEVLGRARGTKNAYKMILDIKNTNEEPDPSMPVCLGYAGPIEPFAGFLAAAKEELSIENPMISEIGSVIGTHTGPGAMGIGYFVKK